MFWKNRNSDRVNCKSLYTDIDTALLELQQRRKNKSSMIALEQEIAMPTELREKLQEPKIVIFRQVATPLHEILRMLDIAKKKGVEPLFFEFTEDKFVGARNIFKRGLGKLPIYTGTNNGGFDLYKYVNVVDFSKQEGFPIKNVHTVHGDNLVHLHHELFEHIVGIKSDDVSIDISHWIFKIGNHAHLFYSTIFKIFLFHAVLAEIYLDSGNEHNFTQEVILPAYSAICSQVQMRPLIWDYLPTGEREKFFWDCYPSQVGDYLAKKEYS